MKKDKIFDTQRIYLWLFHGFITDILDQKENKIYHKLQREEPYNLHSEAYCNYFLEQENSHAINFRNPENLIPQNFVHFKNKKCRYKKISGLM